MYWVLVAESPVIDWSPLEILNVRFAGALFPATFEAVTDTIWAVTALDGVPVIAPLEGSKDKPVGNVPVAMA